jgi:type VI secretion system protein ImpK
MSASEIRDLSFVNDFQEFYTEVIRLRSVAESVDFEATSEEEEAIESRARAIRTRLIGLMERRSLFAGRNAGELGFGLYREVQYVMAALADETFLRLDWKGRDYWTSHLLETQLFNSHNSGELFYTRLDRLLEQPERSYTDIYAVYLMAIALGFRGKYWGVDDGGRLEAYRRRLYVRIYRRQPELFCDGARLFPDSYRHTLDEGIARKLPSPFRWFGVLAFAVVIWVGLAYVAWHRVTDPLEANICTILNPAGSGQADCTPPGEVKQ